MWNRQISILHTGLNDTGRVGDHVVGGLPDNDPMLDNDNGHHGNDDDDDDHYGDNDTPVNTSAEQGMVVDDEGTRDTEQTNTVVDEDQLSVDQVKTTVDDDEIPSLMVGSDKFDQNNYSCHDDNHQRGIHKDTPSDHQTEELSVDIEDTPDGVEEMFHNSVDKLFNISVDELFDDNV